MKQWVPLNAEGFAWLYGRTWLVYRDGGSGRWWVLCEGMVLWDDPYLKDAARVVERLPCHPE